MLSALCSCVFVQCQTIAAVPLIKHSGLDSPTPLNKMLSPVDSVSRRVDAKNTQYCRMKCIFRRKFLLNLSVPRNYRTISLNVKNMFFMRWMIVNGSLCSFFQNSNSVHFLFSHLSDLRRPFLSARRRSRLLLHLYISPQDTTLPSLTHKLYVKVERAGRVVGKRAEGNFCSCGGAPSRGCRLSWCESEEFDLFCSG